MLADSVGLALLAVLDTLTPAERLAFVLHDVDGAVGIVFAPAGHPRLRQLRVAVLPE